jgi:NTP-dependent ternary system trypsin peptidase co-occuring protein
MKGGIVADLAGVELAEFVDALRDQIRTAQAGADPQLPIEVGPITLEFTLTTRREGEGKAGVKFWVVDAGVSGKLGHESSQKVTMQLLPRAPDGEGPARIRDRERVPAGAGGSALRDIERD